MANDGIVVTDRWKGGSPAKHIGKRWRARARDPHTRRYQSRSFDDRAEAERWARERRIQFQAHLDTAKSALFAVWGAAWVERLQLREKSPRYIRQTVVAIETLTAAGARDMRDPSFEAIVERTIARLTLRTKGGIMPKRASEAAFERRRSPAAGKKQASVASKNFYVTVARAVCRFAVRKRAIPYDPLACLEKFTGGTELRRIFGVVELRKMVHERHEHDDWFLFVALLTYTGARSSEVRSMRWDMINWNAALIDLPSHVAGNKMKMARQIPLQAELREILQSRAKVGRGLIVGERIAALPPGSATRGFQDYLTRCGVESAGRGPHCLRHTFCALMASMDVGTFVVMSMVGHTEPVTAKHYASRALELRPQVASWPRGDLHLRRAVANLSSGLTDSQVDLVQQILNGIKTKAVAATEGGIAQQV